MSIRPSVLIAAELKELLPRFLAHRRSELELLRDALGAGDLDAVRRIGHGLKGVGGGYGFDEITRLGGELEALARLGRPEALAPLVAELGRYLDSVEIRFQ